MRNANKEGLTWEVGPDPFCPIRLFPILLLPVIHFSPALLIHRIQLLLSGRSDDISNAVSTLQTLGSGPI